MNTDQNVENFVIFISPFLSEACVYKIIVRIIRTQFKPIQCRCNFKDDNKITDGIESTIFRPPDIEAQYTLVRTIQPLKLRSLV